MTMCYQVLRCKVLLITQWLLIAMTTTNGLIKERNYENEQHVITRYQDIKLDEFTSNFTGNYTTFLHMNEILLVGASNFLLVFNTTNGLQNIKKISWKPEESKSQTTCIQSNIPKDQCFNFIKVLAISNNKLLTCGTNSHYPTCTWRNNETLLLLKDTTPFPGKRFVPFNPHSESSYLFSDDGRFFSGVATKFGGYAKTITGSDFSNNEPLRQLKPLPKLLDDPIFHQSFLIGEYVYFFFDEFAYECIGCDAVRYSRVARICKGDDGGTEYSNWRDFVTFQKARLNCSLPGSYPFHFNILRDIYWDSQTTTFYGVFTTERQDFRTSAICSYSLSDIEKAFSGTFNYKKDGVWQEMANPEHITKCKVNSNSLKSRLIQVQIKGRMKTRSLKASAMDEINQCILAFGAVQPTSNRTLFYLQRIGFRKVAVITFQPNENNSLFTKVWYISTDQGTILKLARIPRTKIFCVFEEYNVFPNNKTEQIKAMKLSPDKEYLTIGSNTRLAKLHLLRCDSYISKSSCLNAQDPLCGWSTIEGKCKPWNKRNKTNWEQNITSCSQREAEWSEWSPWSECQRNDGNLCICRRRTCVNARMFYKCHGADIELKNCTVDVRTLRDKKQWWQDGVVHGGWSQWSQWSNCLRGYQNRSRTCSKPSPRNGGVNCTSSDVEYRLCEPTRFNDTTSYLWTSWNRVNSSERKAVRYKISCTSKAVVMKGLRINVIMNETVNCTNEYVCIDPPAKTMNPFTSNWGSWLSCNDTTEKVRTRQRCVQDLSKRQWSCKQHDVERIERVQIITTTAATASEPTVTEVPYFPEWSQWSSCVCKHNVSLSDSSYGIQHRNIRQEERIDTEYRVCPCKVIRERQVTTTNSPNTKGVEAKKSIEDSDINGFSLIIIIIIVGVCCLLCIIVTALVLVFCRPNKWRRKKLTINNRTEITADNVHPQANGTVPTRV